jgi:hypothetical protein
VYSRFTESDPIGLKGGETIRAIEVLAEKPRVSIAYFHGIKDSLV